jgi:predicted ATPase
LAVALEGYAASRSEAERDELAQRYPALARFVPSLVASRPAPSADARGDQHLDVLAAIVRLLTELARRQPVLLVVGDLDGADSFTVDVLHYLAHLAVQRRWLIVAAVREEQVYARPELARLVEEWTRERLCLRVELACLPRPDCDRLVRGMLSGGCVGDELLELIYARSRGNPLFVEELVSAMRQSQEMVLTGGCWRAFSTVAARVPDRVRAVMAMQLAPLDETVRRVLALAAAAAPEVQLSELRAGAAALEPAVGDPALFDALDRALRMRILEERRSGYAFRHPLVRSAVYEELSRHRRDQLHAALGRSRTQGSRQLRVTSAR